VPGVRRLVVAAIEVDPFDSAEQDLVGTVDRGGLGRAVDHVVVVGVGVLAAGARVGIPGGPHLRRIEARQAGELKVRSVDQLPGDILRKRRSQPAGTFSGGEQQMLAIGRAMMSRPKLLMLDEPSMGLSPLMMQRIRTTIVELQSEGVTILLVEQNAPAALSLANYGYLLEVGKIVLENTGQALLVDENVRKAYLGED
jgi:ABC-type branched-subunit amino acid transport system ATPase component